MFFLIFIEHWKDNRDCLQNYIQLLKLLVIKQDHVFIFIEHTNKTQVSMLAYEAHYPASNMNAINIHNKSERKMSISHVSLSPVPYPLSKSIRMEHALQLMHLP